MYIWMDEAALAAQRIAAAAVRPGSGRDGAGIVFIFVDGCIKITIN